MSDLQAAADRLMTEAEISRSLAGPGKDTRMEDDIETVVNALAASEARISALTAALEKQQAVEDHTLECLYCLHNDEDDCTEIARLRADAGVARADVLAAADRQPDGEG